MKNIIIAILISALLMAGCAPASAPATAIPAVADSPAAATESSPTAITTSQAAASTATIKPTQVVAAVTAEAASAAQGEPAPLAEFADATTIALGETIAVAGPGAVNVKVKGHVVTIAAGGAYLISGKLADGQIIVDSQDKKTVTLALNGADLACSTSAPLYIAAAKAAEIVLVDGSENRLADGETYVYAEADEDEPNATLFSKDDLTIRGDGSLEVEARYHDAITSKDDLAIASGAITVVSVNDGIRGRDRLEITGGVIAVTAAGDGLESNNDQDADKGVVTIENAAIAVVAGEDAIEAETRVAIRSGHLTLTTGGGSANSSSQGKEWGRWGPGARSQSAPTAEAEGDSAKGIKAGAELTLSGGTFIIDSSDDALHSNGDLTINGGAFDIASGDDGAHADGQVAINGGQIVISRSYEGIEGAQIVIADGELHIVSSDDGLNVAGGVDGSALGGRPGQGGFSASGNQYLEINGGYIAVEANGDGLDINGAITMSGGVVLVNGPTSDGNGALDYDRGFKMTGGYLLAVGSAGMAQAPDQTSTQNALMVNLDAAQPAGALVHIAAKDGEEILTYAPIKPYRSVVFCSPELVSGATYLFYTGGATTGQARDGLYSGGEYTAGTWVASVTLTGVVTRVGSSGGSPGGMRGPGGGGRGGR